MSSHISQLILHPYLTQSLKVSSTTVGRDKFYRTIQYLSRFLAFYCASHGYSKETIARLTALKSTLGMSRKLMRIGKPLEHLQAAQKSLEIRDFIMKLTAVGRQVCYAVYLINDTLIWANATKVLPLSPLTVQQINKRAAKYWFAGISFSILSSVYKLNGLRVKEMQLGRGKGQDNVEKEVERRESIRLVKLQRKSTYYQLTQDSLDILLPSATLGYHHFNDGVLGLAGLTTSLMGLNTQVGKVLGK